VTIEGNRTDSAIIESIDAPIHPGFNPDSGGKRARFPAGDGSLGDVFGQQQYVEIKAGRKLVVLLFMAWKAALTCTDGHRGQLCWVTDLETSRTG
jgi:hypothetical protein